MKSRVRTSFLCAGLLFLISRSQAEAQCSACPNASFRAPRSFNLPDAAAAIVSGDLNNDGRPDVATLGFGWTLTVFVNSADTVLAAPTSYPVSTGNLYTGGLAAGDFDGDGNIDLIATGATNAIYLLRGVGNGTFRSAVTIPTTKVNTAIAVGDFNGDGLLDLVSLGAYPDVDTVNIYYGDGTGSFSPPITLPVGPSVSDLQAADLNDDGAAEIVTVNTASNTISIITGIAMGPVAPARNIVVGYGPLGLGIGDWNGDGILDIAVTNSEHVLTILPGDGTLNFPVLIYRNPANFRGRLLVGDFDGDGKQDLIGIENALRFVAGDGGGNFADPTIVGPTLPQAVVADIDQDGRADIVGANLASVGVFSSLSKPTTPEIYSELVAVRLGLADFNGDGKLDVVTFSSGDTYILMSNGSRLTPTRLSISPGGLGFGTIADLNSDGKPDLLFLSNDRLAVYLGTGGAGFLAPIFVPLSSNTSWFSVGDLNRDGKPDVVAANYAGNSVSVLLGRGDGTFDPATDFAVGSRPTSLVLADFNRDGKLDVAVGNDGGTIAVLLGNGGGGFASISSFAVATSPKELIAVDFDQDGKMGLAFLTSEGIPMIMKGNGAGQLSAPTGISPNSYNNSSMISVDFDGDGLPDLAVGDFVGRLSFFRNLGGGAFARSTQYYAGPQIFSLAAGDLDGDGRADVVLWQGVLVETLTNSNCLTSSLAVATDIAGCQTPGGLLSPQPKVSLLDNGSNLVSCDPGPITASLVPTTGTAGAALAGTLSVNGIGGAATYTNLSVNLPGAGYRVEFTHPQGARTRTRSFSQGLQVAITGPTVVCGATASWSPNGVFDAYQWILDGTPASKARRLTRSGIAAGSHTLSLTVTKDGCTATDSHPFTVSSPVSAVVASPATVRAKSTGNTASVADAGPGATYGWTISRGTITAGQGTRTVTFTAGTVGSVVLSVTVTASGGCSAPGTASTVIVAADFNANGQTDLLWRNSSTGENVVWLMNGMVVSSLSAPPSVFDLNWKIGGAADFDGDGQPDILWRNTLDGRNVVWLMNGTSVTAQPSLPAVADQNWQMAGVADFDGDGKPDILWRNRATGENVVWMMNGTAVTSLATVPTVPDLNWKIGGTGDLDGDGKPDIVWRNSATGQDTIWLMNGTAIASQAPLPAVADLNWQIVAVADLDGDGKADLVWRHAASGSNTIWRMNRTVVSSTAPLPTVSDNAWRLAGPR